MAGIRVGPGVLVAAAFIGPGTVTTATVAGAAHGYVLGWGIVCSVLATIVLQEMAARLGVVGRIGLGTAIRHKAASRAGFFLAASLVVLAIGVGNAAYQAGNLSGALLGLDLLTGFAERLKLPILILTGLVVAGLLWSGRVTPVKNLLTVLVLTLSVSYFIGALLVGIDWAALLKGLLPLRLPTGAELTLISLVGTTVVPYNLFLHADAAKAHYRTSDELRAARLDTYLSVVLGGTVTLLIASLSAAVYEQGVGLELTSASQLAAPLSEVLGPAGNYLVGLGLLAAGFTSAITAPLAAAYAMTGLFGWLNEERSTGFRVSWMVVLLTGVVFAALGFAPVALIMLAQAANGLLLPIIAGFLLWCANDKELLGKLANSPQRNLAGATVVLLSLVLGLRSLSKVLF